MPMCVQRDDTSLPPPLPVVGVAGADHQEGVLATKGLVRSATGDANQKELFLRSGNFLSGLGTALVVPDMACDYFARSIKKVKEADKIRQAVVKAVTKYIEADEDARKAMEARFYIVDGATRRNYTLEFQWDGYTARVCCFDCIIVLLCPFRLTWSYLL